MQAMERLFITEDRKRLVAEGDPAGAILYAAPGDEIPQSAAEMFGIVDGWAPDKKRREDGDDKSRKDGSDKDRQDGEDKDTQREGSSGTAREAPSTGSGTSAETSNVGVQPGSQHADDLTAIKGIGAKTAGALAAAGIDTFEKLAAVDRASPPDIGIRASVEEWASWTAQSAVMATSIPGDEGQETPAPGLTINKLPKEG